MNSKILRLSLLAVAVSLSGCATCQRHPVACAIAGAIVVGSVVAAIENNRHDQRAGSPSQQCVGTTWGQILCAAESNH